MSDKMGEQVWVKALRLVNRKPDSQGDIPVEVRYCNGKHLAEIWVTAGEVVPASELQRVTPSLPQTEEEWRSCIGRTVTTPAATERMLLAVEAGWAWITGAPGNPPRSAVLSDISALDPPWVPERDPNIQEAIEVLTTEQIRLAGPPPQFGGRKWREGVVIARGCAADAVDAALTCLHRVGAVGDGER